MSTPDPERVREHFDRESRGYDSRSRRGLWKSLRDREQSALLDLLGPEAGENVLDAGSGAGHYTRLLAGLGCRVTALDFSRPMLDVLEREQGVPTLHADLCTMDLEPVYDRILCAGALEFVPDPAEAMRRLLAGLRPDGPGILVVLVPLDSLPGRLYRYFHSSHGFRVNLFTGGQLESLARAGGDFQLGPRRRVTFNLAARIQRSR